MLVPAYGLVTRDHGAGYIAKLNGIPSFIDGWVDGLRDGLDAGQTATGRGVANAIAAYDRLLRTPTCHVIRSLDRARRPSSPTPRRAHGATR